MGGELAQAQARAQALVLVPADVGRRPRWARVNLVGGRVRAAISAPRSGRGSLTKRDRVVATIGELTVGERLVQRTTHALVGIMSLWAGRAGIASLAEDHPRARRAHCRPHKATAMPSPRDSRFRALLGALIGRKPATAN